MTAANIEESTRKSKHVTESMIEAKEGLKVCRYFHLSSEDYSSARVARMLLILV
jgi:hypothetical protein